jgi:feruloyl-CoA synthase
LCPELDQSSPAAIAEHPKVRQQFQTVVDELARLSTGSSTHIVRAIVLDQPPSIDAREITDKGSLNQKAVLQNRATLVEELYAPTPSARVITAGQTRYGEFREVFSILQLLRIHATHAN